ncbi:MAG: L-rhamnose isomerase [candidate division Zixibacteria bacterium]|nr:L-rhamnose isomerase [candidate division Zixibacteria bacterium]
MSGIEAAYEQAKERYAAYGVDTEKAMDVLRRIPVSMHCWQGDDVVGFESAGSIADGGIMATGNYPGRARTPQELRNDIEKAFSLIPGKHRLNLHACYAETGRVKVDRSQLTIEHFGNWVTWAGSLGIGMDFNPTCFAHPKAATGFTLASADVSIRQYWIDHCIACRHIGAGIGKALGNPCVTNIWIPDGYKDMPADRKSPRERLERSLDAVLAERLNPAWNLDSVECKLFGIGSESYVVGSHEFYMGYAVSRKVILCLDAGHFHPTEEIGDKLSSVLLFVPEVLLHVSRGVRWDSDHVVILSDALENIASELVRSDALDRVHVGLDFFDASINRVAAWVIGTRCMVKALLIALLEPREQLRGYEEEGDFTSRLALMEELKTLPFGAVWDYYCTQQGAPVGMAWMDEIKTYERNVLSRRG